MLKEFKKHEQEIGTALSESEHISYEKTHTLGPCHQCKDGHLMIRKSRFGLFSGCSNYPDCKTTFNLPKQAIVKPAHKQCEHCNYPIVLVKPQRKRERETCINPKCITWTAEYQKKLEDEREKAQIQAAKEGEEEEGEE